MNEDPLQRISRMPDDAYHRTFRLFKPVGWTDPALPLHALGALAGGMTGRLPYNGIAAYQIAGEKLRQIRIDWRKDQDFEKHATPWEKDYSKLAGAGNGADPVVDHDLMVVGHYGLFGGRKIFVPKGRGNPSSYGGVAELRTLLREDSDVFVRHYNPLPSSHEQFEDINASVMQWLLLTGIDGRVLAVGGFDHRGIEPSAFSPADVIGFARLIGRLVVTVVGVGGRLVRSLTVRPAARVLTGGSSAATRPVGRITIEEMERHLTDVLARRPELRRLMAARVMTGQGRMDAIKIALQEWERTQGWKVVEKTAREMQAVTHPKNLMTLRAESRELWINKDRAARWDPNEFYDETVHELAAHALAGRGGSLTEAHIAFIGHEFGVTNNAARILESTIKTGDLKQVLRLFR
jgi:hypothetical protein